VVYLGSEAVFFNQLTKAIIMFDPCKAVQNLKSVKSLVLADPTISDGYDDLLDAILMGATHDCFEGLSTATFEKNLHGLQNVLQLMRRHSVSVKVTGKLANRFRVALLDGVYIFTS
jgi:hypothetical protein